MSTSDNSAFTSEQVLTRLASARSQASKEANRLFLASLVFAGLYLIKASGLRIDITLLDANVAKVPHGVFFFLAASQISVILCYMRTADAVSVDRRLRGAIKKFGHGNVEEATKTFINDYEWFSATISEFDAKSAGRLPTFIYNLTSILTFPTWFILYVLPVGCGIYTLINWKALIVTGNVDLQFWVLLATTTATTLWLINFIALQFALLGEPRGGTSRGDKVQRGRSGSTSN